MPLAQVELPLHLYLHMRLYLLMARPPVQKARARRAGPCRPERVESLVFWYELFLVLGVVCAFGVFFVGVSIGADVVFICRRALECLAVTNKMHGLRLQLICLPVPVPVAAMLGLLLVVMERLEAMQRRVAVVVQVARSR
jgi:hypothetical protein